MKIKKIMRGEIDFSTENNEKRMVDVSDPCYNKGECYRIENVAVQSGIYQCNSWVCVDSSDKYDIGRTMVCEVVKKDYKPAGKVERKKLGMIGVDAGLAGVYSSDMPGYKEEWNRFLEETKENEWEFHLDSYGFCTHSGYGDGCYEVFAEEDENGIFKIEINF